MTKTDTCVICLQPVVLGDAPESIWIHATYNKSHHAKTKYINGGYEAGRKDAFLEMIDVLESRMQP